MQEPNRPKIALVHDHLTQDGGAERVLRVLSSMFPEAPVFTLVHDKNAFRAMEDKDIRTSFIQQLPFGLRKFQWFLPLMPSATEHHDLRAFDLVLSSSSALSKGVIPGTHATHICYCHTPTRYLWTDTHEYIQSLKVPGLIKRILPVYLSHMRKWDRMAADRVDHFVANSHTVKHRIQTFYRREAHVVYPPVDTEQFAISEKPKTYFLAGGRIAAYKRFDLVVDAFNRLKLPLKIFGSGPFLDELAKRSKDNIEFLGRVTDEKKAELYANCIAYLNPQEEDFGITAIEAMAAGRPVIAYAKGGATETVIEGLSGTLFRNQIWEDVADTVFRFDDTQFDPYRVKQHAEQFSRSAFEQKIREHIHATTGFDV